MNALNIHAIQYSHTLVYGILICLLCTQPTPTAFQPGDAVTVRNVIDEAEKLQEGHGGWNEDMAEVRMYYVVEQLSYNIYCS